MGDKYKSVKGTYDVLPEKVGEWLYIEEIIHNLMNKFNYSQIRVPIIENTQVFTRSLGEATDVVKKEMYTIKQKTGSISLRPEATAGVVRSYIEHNIYKKEKFSKFYYIGPMFRKEQPQSGRNRQFYQFGVEAIGSNSSFIDSEMISLLNIFFNKIDLKDYKIKINTLGCDKDKLKISNILRQKLSPYRKELCENCKRRIDKNVFRVLDCKNDNCHNIVKKLPLVKDLICEDCKTYYSIFKRNLEELKIDFIEDNSIVRGLDYYTGPVFEITHESLGAQNTIAAGGRYDNLIQKMGGPKTEAVGFAVGMERLLLCLKERKQKDRETDFFLVSVGKEYYKKAFKLLHQLRQNDIKADMDYTVPSMKGQMKQADKINAEYTIFIGEEEINNRKLTVKNMVTGKQFKLHMDGVVEEMKKLL